MLIGMSGGVLSVVDWLLGSLFVVRLFKCAACDDINVLDGSYAGSQIDSPESLSFISIIVVFNLLVLVKKRFSLV